MCQKAARKGGSIERKPQTGDGTDNSVALLNVHVHVSSGTGVV